MKKLFVAFAVILTLCSCSFFKDDVLDSLGRYQSKNYYSDGGFQDFTDYAKYTFKSVDLDANRYFEQISADSKKALELHLENFESWVETIRDSTPRSELVSGYDFDQSVITENDYLYIYDDPDYHELGCYDVYFFDSETLTLYYFHNNI